MASYARFHDDRSPRSPRGAEASAAQARSRRTDRRSDGQSLAPLRSTASEHAASTLRCHPGHEAMLALARALLGLIGPLRHGCVPFPRSRSRWGPSHTNGWRIASLRMHSRWPVPLWLAILPASRWSVKHDGGTQCGKRLPLRPPSTRVASSIDSRSADLGHFTRDRVGRTHRGGVAGGGTKITRRRRNCRLDDGPVMSLGLGAASSRAGSHCPAVSGAAIVARPPARTA